MEMEMAKEWTPGSADYRVCLVDGAGGRFVLKQ